MCWCSCMELCGVGAPPPLFTLASRQAAARMVSICRCSCIEWGRAAASSLGKRRRPVNELRLWWCYFLWRCGFGPLEAEPAYDQPKKAAEDEQAHSQPCDLAVSVATRRLNAVAAFIRRRR